MALPLLSACSSFVQQAAPVESASPASVRPTQMPPTTTGTVVSGGAQATPYQVVAPVRATPMAVAAVDRNETTHVVQPGENLFRISLNHGLKYQQVAAWNNMSDTTIKVGQVLRLTPPGGNRPLATSVAPSPATAKTVAPAPVAATSVKPYPKALKLPYSDEARSSLAAQSEGRVASDASARKPATAQRPPVSASSPVARATVVLPSPATDSSAAASASDTISWQWPTKGKLLRGFSDANKGLDIGGTSGQAIVAAADGKVVYSDDRLRGYGKLIIIKHNKTYLSAYAHNSQLLVKEGQTVKKGQKIAKMGNTDADQVKLHFEVRRIGIPVDPMQYLESRP